MKSLFYFLPLCLFLTLLSGCASMEKINPFAVARKNVKNSKRLRVGMTKHQVLEIMGEPLRDETFNKPDVWYYYYRMNWGDGLTTEDECFPLLFHEGKLIGWGNDFLVKYRRENKNRIPDTQLPIPYGSDEKTK